MNEKDGNQSRENLNIDVIFSQEMSLYSGSHNEYDIKKLKTIPIFPDHEESWSLSDFLSFANKLIGNFAFSGPIHSRGGKIATTISYKEQPIFQCSLTFSEMSKIDVHIYYDYTKRLMTWCDDGGPLIIREEKTAVFLSRRATHVTKLTLQIRREFPEVDDFSSLLSPLIAMETLSPIFRKFYKVIVKTIERPIFNSNLLNQLNSAIIFPEIALRTRVSAVVQTFKGYWRIYWSNEIVEKGRNRKESFFNGSLQELHYIPPESVSVLKASARIACIQLDCSFHFFDPYVFAIPSAIIQNAYLPFGLAIGCSENAELFRSFYEFFFNSTQIELKEYPVLSDMGSAIRSFCEGSEIRQYFCCTHILRSIGNNSKVRFLIKRLLKLQIIEDAERCLYLLKDTVNRTTLNQGEVDAFRRIGIIVYDNGLQIDEWEPLFEMCCLVYRLEDCIPPSTNSEEGLHSHINEHKRRNQSFWTKVQIIIEMFMDRYRTYGKRLQALFRASMRKHEKYCANRARSIIDAELIEYQSTPNSCECNETRKLSQLFRIKVPCCHQVHLGSKIPDTVDLPKFAPPENVHQWDAIQIDPIPLDKKYDLQKIAPEKEGEEMEQVTDSRVAFLMEFVCKEIKRFVPKKLLPMACIAVKDFMCANYSLTEIRGTSMDYAVRIVITTRCIFHIHEVINSLN